MQQEQNTLKWRPLPYKITIDRGALIAALDLANPMSGTLQSQRIWFERSGHPDYPVRIIACNSSSLIVINSPGKVEGLITEGTELFDGDTPEPYYIEAKKLIDMKLSRNKFKLKWRATITQYDQGETYFYDEVTEKTALIQTHNPNLPKPTRLKWQRILPKKPAEPAVQPEVSAASSAASSAAISAEKDKFNTVTNTAALIRTAAIQLTVLHDHDPKGFTKFRLLPGLTSDPHASILFASTNNSVFANPDANKFPF